jgi:imidazolonepropionase-like amidohydrolase
MSTEKTVTVIKNGRLIDGTGSEPVDGSVIVVSGGRIVEAGAPKDVEIPDHAIVVDAAGKTVMPGLIDSHLHLSGDKTSNFLYEEMVVPAGVKLIRASTHAKLLLEAGYTTVKDCGGINAVYIRKAIEEGTIAGPRILAAGHALSQTFGHGDTHFMPIESADTRRSPKAWGLLCDGVDECIKAARYAFREGADFIKVMTSGGVLSERDKPEHSQFTVEEIKAIVGVAKSVGSFVTAHCQSTQGMHNSIEAGVKTIDHAFYPDEWVMENGKKNNTIFVPTLSIMKRINDNGVEAGFPEWGVRKCREATPLVLKNIAKLREAGCTIASGTDFSGSDLTKMGTNALELELLVKLCGFSPMEAIVSSTLNGAKACGLENQLGSIQKGKLADIIIVDGDPLTNVAVLQDQQRIRMVIFEGRICVNRGLTISA